MFILMVLDSVFSRFMHAYSKVNKKRVYVKSISGSEDPLDDGKSYVCNQVVDFIFSTVYYNIVFKYGNSNHKLPEKQTAASVKMLPLPNRLRLWQ